MSNAYSQRGPRGRDDEPEAYTGETLVLPRRNRPDAPRRPASPPARRPRPPRRRIWPRVRLALLLIAVAVAGVLLLLYLQVRGVAGRLVTPDARPGPILASPLGPVNLLLIGVDERPDFPEEGVRSDTLIVVHLDAPGRWAGMLSIPRDSRVPVRDLGETKINTAYGYGYANSEVLYGPGTTPQQGGMALAAETVEQFLGIPIHYTAQVNFDGFARIIDALGGITIDVPRRIVDDAYPTPDFGITQIVFEPGVQRMDGATALIYARTRHADSDFGRAERQQQVIRAIVDELRARGPAGQALLLPRLGEGLEGAVVTTLPFDRPDALAGLGWLAAGLDPDAIARLQLSPETAPSMREEGSDLLWDPAEVHALARQLQTRPDIASEAALVQVLNGTGVQGLAGRTTAELEAQGFTVLPAGDAASDDIERTVVYDVGGAPQTARRLAQLFGADVRRGAPEGVVSDADVVVVLGRDAAGDGP